MNEKKQIQWLKQTVNGKSFADVGGLWRTVNEKISVAHEAGASSLTMIDIQPHGNIWWKKFDERMQLLKIECKNIVADATASDFSNKVNRYDVVYCSGILYHLPSPYQMLSNLRKIVNEYIILVSMTIPNRIENEGGVIELYGGLSLFAPSLNESQRNILRRHFGELGIRTHTITDVNVSTLLNADGSAGQFAEQIEAIEQTGII